MISDTIIFALTGQYERKNRERSFDRKPKEEREERRDEKRSYQRSDGRGRERSGSKGDMNDGCFKCYKPGHFASECYSKYSRPKPQKDAAYYKKKAEYYTQRSLLAEKDDLQTDESSADEANDPSFCGMANIDSPESDQEVSTSIILIRLKACSLNLTENSLLLILSIQIF